MGRYIYIYYMIFLKYIINIVLCTWHTQLYHENCIIFEDSCPHVISLSSSRKPITDTYWHYAMYCERYAWFYHEKITLKIQIKSIIFLTKVVAVDDIVNFSWSLLAQVILNSYGALSQKKRYLLTHFLTHTVIWKLFITK